MGDAELHTCITLHINQCADGFIITPLQQNMSTDIIVFFQGCLKHNTCHPDTDSQGIAVEGERFQQQQ